MDLNICRVLQVIEKKEQAPLYKHPPIIKSEQHFLLCGAYDPVVYLGSLLLAFPKKPEIDSKFHAGVWRIYLLITNLGVMNVVDSTSGAEGYCAEESHW